VGIRCADHATLYPQRLALTSPTSGGRWVDIVTEPNFIGFFVKIFLSLKFAYGSSVVPVQATSKTDSDLL
jgi:hypothetical protein